MKIAYIISAYQDPNQLKRLVCALDSDSDFYIHIDKKVEIKSFIELFIDNPNVYFTQNRFFTNWGSFAQVLSHKELLRSVFESDCEYDRVVCLSGTDYPILSNSRLQLEFSLNRDRQYIMGFNLSMTKNKNEIERISFYHFFRDIRIKNVYFKRLFSGGSRILLRLSQIRKKKQVYLFGKFQDVYMGSDYWSLTIDCAKFVFNCMCNEETMMNYFKYSYVPSEMVVQTIVFNSRYAKHAIEYLQDYPGLVSLTPIHFINYDNGIKIWNELDYYAIINSKKMFFRKAKTGISEQLLSLIDENRIANDTMQK